MSSRQLKRWKRPTLAVKETSRMKGDGLLKTKAELMEVTIGEDRQIVLTAEGNKIRRNRQGNE